MPFGVKQSNATARLESKENAIAIVVVNLAIFAHELVALWEKQSSRSFLRESRDLVDLYPCRIWRESISPSLGAF